MYGFILNLMALRGEPACSPFMKLFIAFPDWVRYIFWQPQVATWGYSYSTPSGLCSLILIDFLYVMRLGNAIF